MSSTTLTRPWHCLEVPACRHSTAGFGFTDPVAGGGIALGSRARGCATVSAEVPLLLISTIEGVELSKGGEVVARINRLAAF
jgi:hypothetical protein